MKGGELGKGRRDRFIRKRICLSLKRREARVHSQKIDLGPHRGPRILLRHRGRRLRALEKEKNTTTTKGGGGGGGLWLRREGLLSGVQLLS